VRRISIILLVALVAVAAAAVARAAQSPKKLRSSIQHAVFSQAGVHYSETASAKGLKQTTVGDAATDRGSQDITVHLGGKTGHFTVIVIVNTAYLRADATALNAYLGFPSTAARKYAGRWISIPRTSAAFGTLAADVTVSSLVADHVATRKTSIVGGTLGGRSVIGLRGVTTVGGVSNTSTVYVRSAKQALPIEATDFSSKHGFRDTIEFSRWNETVSVKAPRHAVSISKLS